MLQLRAFTQQLDKLNLDRRFLLTFWNLKYYNNFLFIFQDSRHLNSLFLGLLDVQDFTH